MANTTKIYTSEQGDRYGVHYVCYGDTDLTNELILDTSTFGTIPAKMAVESIRVAGGSDTGGWQLTVEFDDATDVPILFLTRGDSGDITYEYDSHGMDLIVGPTIAGATGDIIVTTAGKLAATEGFTLTLVFRATV